MATNGTTGPPPPQGSPLISGRVDTELSASDITLGNVTLVDPATGDPVGTTGGALDVAITSPAVVPVVLPHDPLPVTFTPAAQTHYLAAASASLSPVGGTITLPAPLATTRIDSLSLSLLPTAALTGIPSVSVQLQTGSTVLWAGVVSGAAPPPAASIPSGILVGATTLSLVYGVNGGSLTLYYTVTGVSP